MRGLLVSIGPESFVTTDLVAREFAAHAVLEGTLRALVRAGGPLKPGPDPVEALHVAENVRGVLRFEVAEVAAQHSVLHVRRFQVVLQSQNGLCPEGAEPTLA